jgi:2,4-dienoyl-CoA reductase (NADPH2)
MPWCCAPDRNRNGGFPQSWTDSGIPHHLIGGADVAAELDAKRAINQAARLAARL